jgi:hypothetical protein
MNEKRHDIVLLRSVDSRWWGLENELTIGYFRWTYSRSDFRILHTDVSSVDIEIECHPDRCGDITIVQNGNVITTHTPTGGEPNIVHVEITNYDDFEIHCKTFVPREMDRSNDPRELGIMVTSFVLNTDDEPCRVEMDEIPLWFDSPAMHAIQEKFTKGLINTLVDYSPKPFNISTPMKHGAVLYLDKPYPRLMKQLKEDYKFSKSCELITYTDNPAVEADIHVPEFYSEWKRKYEYANMAGQEAVRIAQSKGWDYFMWVEWDCYIGKDCWFDILWDEMLGWPYKPLQAGTPSMSSQPLIGNFEFMKQDYISSYIKANKVCLHLILNRPFFVSVNAALGFYNTEAADDFLIRQGIPPLSSFDVLFGMRMFDKYQEDVFKHTAWLPSLYSGWGEQDYTEAQRLHMVDSGFKVAMHQYKVV